MIQNGMRSVSVRTTSESKWNSGTAAVSKLPYLSPYQCICFTSDRRQGTHSTKKLRIDHDIMADPTSPADIFTGQHMSAARPTIDQSSVLTTSRIFLTFPSLCYPRSRISPWSQRMQLMQQWKTACLWLWQLGGFAVEVCKARLPVASRTSPCWWPGTKNEGCGWEMLC